MSLIGLRKLQLVTAIKSNPAPALYIMLILFTQYENWKDVKLHHGNNINNSIFNLFIWIDFAVCTVSDCTMSIIKAFQQSLNSLKLFIAMKRHENTCYFDSTGAKK